MKNAILALLLLMFLPDGLVRAQEATPSYKQRNMRQQLFAIDYMKAHPLQEFFATPDDIDAYLQGLTAAWLEEAGEADPVFRRFDSYVPHWLLNSLALQTNTQAPEWATCHVWKTYMVPAFLTDYAFFSNEPTSDKAFLIWQGSASNVFDGRAFRCALPESVWASLVTTFTTMPAVIDAYLDEGAYTDEKVERRLRSVRRSATGRAPYFEIMDALYEDRRDAAFAHLAAIFAEQRPALNPILLGRNLAEAYQAAGEPFKALAALDLLIRSTTPQDLPRDSLSRWYTAIDPERGPARFRLLRATAGLPTLIASEHRVVLSGRYTNLATGEPFDLAALNGKMVLLDFWFTGCAPCIAEIPNLNAIDAQYGGDDFAFVSISSDPVIEGPGEAETRAFAEEYGMAFLALLDDPEHSLTEQFNVNNLGWPRKFLINENGDLMTHPTDKSRRWVSLEEAEAYLSARWQPGVGQDD